MKFGNPIVLNWLWLAPLIVAFFWFAWRQRRRALEMFAAPHLLPVMAPTLNERLGLVRAALVTTAIVSLVLALALPRWGYNWQEVKRRGIDIFVALDVSKSMLAQDVRPSRLEQAKFAVRDLLKLAAGDRVGLIAFAGTTFISCPLTLDHAAVQLMLEDMTPDAIPVPGTDIASVIKEAMRGFGRSADRNRALILITDGEATEGSAAAAAKTAANMGIKIFTIGIGTASGELIPVPTESGSREFLKDRDGRVVQTKLDEATLQEIALATKGYYVHATGGNFGLDTIYRDGIETMAPKDFETQLMKRYEERFQWPLGFTLALLMVEALLRERRKETRGFVSSAPAASRATVVFLAFILNSSLSAAADITDPPPRLFNEGNAIYRQQQFDAAAKAYQQSLTTKDSALQQRAFYNLGNASYRLADPAEMADPKRAEELFKQAITCYDSALALDPKDEDAAFNKKLVEVRLKKLQEQQQQRQNQQQKQGKQQQQQAAQQQKQDQNKPDDQQQQQQQAQQAQQQQQQQQQQKPGEQQKQEKKPGEDDGQPDKEREMSEQEAKLLLDALRDEEKQWKERKPLRKLGDREPDKTW
jgi:Ca-activated chloride channel family protein